MVKSVDVLHAIPKGEIGERQSFHASLIAVLISVNHAHPFYCTPEK